jgi:hypothetical protein
MSKLSILSLAAAFSLTALAAYFTGHTVAQEKKVSRVYELRTYTTEPGRLPALNKRFRDHTMRLFEKHGMRNEMYWTPTDAPLSENTLIYVISHDSVEAAKKSWAAFQADPEWQKVKAESEADGKILTKVTSVYMTPTDYSPNVR